MELPLARLDQSWARLEILNEISCLFPKVLDDSEDVIGRNIFYCLVVKYINEQVYQG
jgi:hypothetical protein